MGWKRNRGHRSDENAPGIIRDLRRAGVVVECIGRPCDLLCLSAGRLYLLDVDGVTKNRERDDKQLENFALWGVILVKTTEEALRAVRKM